MPPKIATKVLSAFAANLQYEDLPTEVISSVKKMILDTYGCALAATTLGDGCTEVLSVIENLENNGDASILGNCKRVTAPYAAFANGALTHALNYDPIGPDIGHLGIICLAAPLAMAEAAGGKTGRDLIVASAVACELTARITLAINKMGKRPSEKFLSGQLLNYFGAAAGAARILGLDSAGMQSALGLALMQMAGSLQITQGGDPPAKAIYGAFPNQAGVQAALLAEGGLVSNIDIFGSPAGLYPSIYGRNCDEAVLTEDIGDTFYLTQVGFKPWPTSEKLHAPIEAAMQIAEEKFVPKETTHVRITVNPTAAAWCEPLVERRRPVNAAAAANSIPYCTARALTSGNVILSHFTETALADPTVRHIAEHTTCVVDNMVTGATVFVTMADGREHYSVIDQPLGSGARPISDEHLNAKFRDCCAHAKTPLNVSQADKIINFIESLEDIEDIRILARLSCDGQTSNRRVI